MKYLTPLFFPIVLLLSALLSVSLSYALTNWVDEAGFNDIADSSYRVGGAVRIAPVLRPTLQELINSVSNSVSETNRVVLKCNTNGITEVIYVSSETNTFNQNYDPIQHKLDYVRRLNSIPRPISAIDELIDAVEELNNKLKQANSNNLETLRQLKQINEGLK